MKILAISGSLKKDSFNTKLLEASLEHLPEGVEMEIVVPNFPLFNQDLEDPLPDEIKAFKKSIVEADGILISTPEHNWTVSAATKNMIEWGNRPWKNNSWKNKIVGIMSASSSHTGGLRVQLDMRKIATETSMIMFNWPQMMLGEAKNKFNEEGRLVDEKSIERLKRFLEHFIKFVETIPKDPNLFTTSE